MKRRSFFKPSTDTKDLKKKPAKVVTKRVRSSDGREQIRFVGHENDLTKEQILERLRHMQEVNTVTHAVYEFTYAQRCKMERMLQTVTRKMELSEPLSAYEMRYLVAIKMPQRSAEPA